MAASINFSYAVSKRLALGKMKLSDLLSTYWASESIVFVHLGLSSLSWQPY